MNLLNLQKNHAKSRKTYSFTNLSRIVWALATILALSLFFSSTAHSETLGSDQLGGVSLDNKLQTIIKRLGPPKVRTKELYDERASCWVRVYYFVHQGLEVEACRRGRHHQIRSLRVVKDQRSKMSRGVGVGDSVRELTQAYPEAQLIGDHTVKVEDPERRLTINFLLDNWRVYEINFFRDSNIKEHTVKLSSILSYHRR